ncbi:MAG: PAS domain S-box protein [Thermodesulfobacteriota bacterium]
MLKKWLGFELTTEQEDRYRQSRLQADLAQARIGIWLIVIPFVIFFFNDYQFFGLSGWFYGLTVGRLGFLVYTLWLLGFMKKVKDYRSYDRAEFLWGVTIVCFTMVVNITRPHFIGHVAVVIVSVFVTLLIIPNQFANQFILSLAFVIGETLIITLNLQAPVIQTAFSILLSMFLATAIGISSSWQLHFWRRREFLARGEEQRLLEELRRNREWLQVTLSSIGDGVIAVDKEGRITFLNPVAAGLTGWQPEESKGQLFQGVFRIINEKTGQPAEDIVARVLSDKCVVMLANNTVLITRDDRQIPIEDSAAPIFDAAGNIIGVVLSFHDVTEKRRRQEALRESEKKYHTLFNSIIEGFCIIEMVFDAEGRPVDYRFLEINREFEKQTGLHDAEGKLMRDLAPDHEAHWFEIYGKIALTGEPARFVNEAKALNRWYDVCAFRVDEPENRRVAICFSDITERKRAEEKTQKLIAAVQQERDRLSALVNSITDEVWFADIKKQFTLANPSALQEFDIGTSDGAIDVEKFAASLEVYRPDGSPRPVEEAPPLRALQGEVVRNQEETIRTPRTGGLRFRQVSAAPVKDAEGHIIGSVSVVRDITERKQMEEQLKQSEEKSRLLIKYAPSMLYEIDFRRTAFKSVNDAMCEFLGYTREELLAMSPFDLLDDEGKAVFRERISRILAGEAIPGALEYKAIRKDGREVYGVLNMTFTYKDGKPEGAVVVAHDITERKRAEEALKRAHDELEVRVQERTAELAQRNKELIIEIAERLKMEQALEDSKKQLRILASQILSAQENERKRIALEVHDVLGASLSAIKFKVEEALHNNRNDKATSIAESLEAVIPLVQDTIEEARRIQSDLRPPMLDDLGIIATFSWLCRRFESIYTDIRIEREITIQEEEVPDYLKIALFRIAQEAMNNIGKYARADLVHLGLGKVNGTIELTIQDCGEGFDQERLSSMESSKKGMGLSSMRERTEILDGSFSIKSTIGKGTVIKASWPI